MNIPPFVKDNWPYIAGGVIGIAAILYMRSASSGTAVSSTDSTSALIAQNQAAQLAASSQQATIDAQNAVIAQRQREADQNYSLGVQTLMNAQYANNNAAQVAYAGATGEIASALGSASNQIINALNTPAIAAMNYASQENQATVAAAGTAAAASYYSQAAIAGAAMKIPTVLASTVGTQGQNAVATSGSSSNYGDLIKTAGNLAAAYYTGGASLAVTGV